jgi:hypothetical protein
MFNHFYDESEKEITNNLHTRFLLAQLLMDSFRDKLTVRDVKSALQNLPQGSDACVVAYHAAMERIFAQGEGSSKMARKILAWILCAHRPLSTLELLHALAIERGDTEIDEDNILEAGQLLTICAGLVTIDEQSDSVRFIHYTTQEYLQRNQQTWLPHAEIDIARSCTAYLSIDGLAVGPCSSEKEYISRMENYPLLGYAAANWGTHLNTLSDADHIVEDDAIFSDALNLLVNDRCLSSASQTLFMSKRKSYSRTAIAKEGEGLLGCHWIAYFGLLTLFRIWTTQKLKLDESDFFGRTPLSWAAESGQEALVRQLLSFGQVCADSKDTAGRTPLFWSAKSGQTDVTKLWIDSGRVNVNSTDDNGLTPLSWAARYGRAEIVELLLGTGIVRVEREDKHSRTALYWAAKYQYEAVYKLLLNADKTNHDADSDYEAASYRLASKTKTSNNSKASTKSCRDTFDTLVAGRIVEASWVTCSSVAMATNLPTAAVCAGLLDNDCWLYQSACQTLLDVLASMPAVTVLTTAGMPARGCRSSQGTRLEDDDCDGAPASGGRLRGRSGQKLKTTSEC